MSPLLQTVYDWAKQTYPVNARIYRVWLEYDLWRALALELWEHRMPSPIDGGSFAVTIRNVHIEPRM
jgi:hypothetical protein